MTVTLALVLEPHHDGMNDDDPVAWTSGYVAGLLRSHGLLVLSCSVRMPEPAPALASLERERHPTLLVEPVLAEPDDGDGWAVWAEDDIPAAAETPDEVVVEEAPDVGAALDVGPGLRQALAAAADTMHEIDTAAADPQPVDPHPAGFHGDLVEQRGDERRQASVDELAAAFPMERRPFDPDRVRQHQADAERPRW